MMQFDWMEAWNKRMYYEVTTSKVWAVIDINTGITFTDPPTYWYDGDVYLDVDKLKQIIENKFSRYGSCINSVKEQE